MVFSSGFFPEGEAQPISQWNNKLVPPETMDRYSDMRRPVFSSYRLYAIKHMVRFVALLTVVLLSACDNGAPPLPAIETGT